MLASAFIFLARSISDFFVLLLLMRLYLQFSRVSFRHPLTHMVLALTNWMVLPLRRIIPPMGRFDTVSFTLAWLWALLLYVLVLTMMPIPYALTTPESMLALAGVSLLELVKMSLYLLFAVVIGQVVMSWLAPYNPLMPTLQLLTAPFLRPLQRLIHPISGIDLSPLILLLLIQMILNIFIVQLEALLLQFISLSI